MKFFICWLICWLLTSNHTKAENLFADLSNHVIYINSQFQGNDLLLFGYVDKTLSLENQDNLIVMIEEPKRT